MDENISDIFKKASQEVNFLLDIVQENEVLVIGNKDLEEYCTSHDPRRLPITYKEDDYVAVVVSREDFETMEWYFHENKPYITLKNKIY